MFCDDYNQFKQSNNKTAQYKFKKLFDKIFQNPSTTEKDKLLYLNDHEFIQNARNSIFKNLRLNQSFLEETIGGLNAIHLDDFFQTIQSSALNIDNHLKAQILLLLHFSKSKTDKSLYQYVFSSISSIQIVENPENDFINDLAIISDLVLELTGKELHYKIEETKLTYFNCRIVRLFGFAGLDEIYINLNEQSSLYSELIEYENKNAILILKLNFVRLIVHEMVHVAFRATIKDFNASTPNQIKYSENRSLKNISHHEAGCIAEERLFNERIDWLKSAKHGVNVEYCKAFLNSLLNGNKPVFDKNKANVKIDDSIPVCSAVDMCWKIGKLNLLI